MTFVVFFPSLDTNSFVRCLSLLVGIREVFNEINLAGRLPVHCLGIRVVKMLERRGLLVRNDRYFCQL